MGEGVQGAAALWTDCACCPPRMRSLGCAWSCAWSHSSRAGAIASPRRIAAQIFKEQESFLWEENLQGRTLEELGLADEAGEDGAPAQRGRCGRARWLA